MGIRYNQRNLVLLSAFALSDGGVSPKGKNCWTIYFRNKDKLVIEEFQHHLINCMGRPGCKINRKDGTVFVKIDSTKLGKKLFTLSESYRTKPCAMHPICGCIKGIRPAHGAKSIEIDGVKYPPANLPKQVFKHKSIAKQFLRNYITCDGGVSVTYAKNNKGSLFLVRKIFIAVEHPTLNKQLTELLINLGYSPCAYEDQVRLTRKEDIKKFKKEIGFIKGAKISNDSKYLNGLEKNKVLDMIIESYQNPHMLLSFLLKTRSFLKAQTGLDTRVVLAVNAANWVLHILREYAVP